MKTHPTEADLALLAGSECGVVSRYFLNRHVRRCETCLDTVAEFVMLRNQVAADMPDLDWDRLEAEMRANVHLGLEAGECVRRAPAARFWNPQVSVAFASLLLLVAAGFAMHVPNTPAPAPALSVATLVLESSGSGLELRSGDSSLTLMNHHGGVADQTVSAEGIIRARYIDTGGVTTNNVYME